MGSHPLPRSTSVAVVGAGPVGLSLAVGLSRQGIDCVVLEREEQTSEYSKAPGIHIRTREILRRWGIVERFEDEGVLHESVELRPADGGRPLLAIDYSELEVETEQPGLLILEQGRTERLLLDALLELGTADVHFGSEVVALDRGDRGASLTVRRDGQDERLEARFVVGCDGAGSFVREALGLPFEGMTYSLAPMLADVRLDDDPGTPRWVRVWTDAAGYTFAVRLKSGLWRLVHLEATEPATDSDVSHEEVESHVNRLLGRTPAEVVWASRFRIHLRSVPRFRQGNVLLAGDAAHVHSPVGGLGMNAGMGDADNLAWKLAYALRGGDTERLLDSYDLERRPVVAGTVSGFTDTLTRIFLQSGPTIRNAAFAALRQILRVPSMRRRLLRQMTLLDLHYASSPILNPGGSAVGERLPNPLLERADGRQARLYDLLPPGPVLIDVAHSRPFARELPLADVIRVGPLGWRDRAGVVRRLLGDRDGWLLVRPDSYIGWADDKPVGVESAVQRALGGVPVEQPG